MEGMNELLEIENFKVGDIVHYAWSPSDVGVVIDINPHPYGPKSVCQLYLKVLWNKTKGNKNCWLVPVDRWIRKAEIQNG